MIIFLVLITSVAILQFRDSCIYAYKVSYYEAKLKYRDVDISHIENITFREILR